MGLEGLQGASGLAGDLLRVGPGTFGGGEFGQRGLGLGDPRRAALLVALLPPRAAGHDVPLSLLHDLDELIGIGQLELLVLRQLAQQLLQGGVAEAGHELEPALFQRLQVELAAHAAVESEHRLADLETPAQDFDEALQGRRIGPVATQHGEVQRHAAGVGRHGQDDLRPVAAVIAAMAVATKARRAFALKVNTRQIIEHEADGLLECLGGQALFQGAPVAAERVHGFIQIVLVETLISRQAAGRCQQSAGGLRPQGQLGTGKKQARENHGLEQGALAGRANAGKEAR